MYEQFVWYTHTTFYIKKSDKQNTCVLASIILHETMQKNTKKYFRVLSCVIYSIIDNFSALII